MNTRICLQAASLLLAGGAIGRGLPLSTVQFTSDRYRVAETNGVALITVERTGPLDGFAFVNYATGDVSATAGQDYTSQSGTLSFFGETNLTIAVPILDDALVERIEGFTIRLSDPDPLDTQLGERIVAFVEIVSNDQGIRFSDAQSLLVDEGAGMATLTVVRDADPNGPVSVEYVTDQHSPSGDQEARSGQDFVAQRGMLHFASDEVCKTIAVPLINDALRENNEAFSVGLFNPTGGAELGFAYRRFVVIRDNDTGVQFSRASYGVDKMAGVATLTVQRLGEPANSFAVEFATSNATAWAGLDYKATNGLLTFSEGESTQTLRIPIRSDGVYGQADKSFWVRLSNPTAGVALGDFAAAEVIIVDPLRPGSLDVSFDPSLERTNIDRFVPEPPTLMVLRPDGRILVAGSFLGEDGVTRQWLSQLNSNASIDVSFEMGENLPGPVLALAGQSDGSTLVAGAVEMVDFFGLVIVSSRLMRYDTFGMLDTSFSPVTVRGYCGQFSCLPLSVGSIAPQADGKVLISHDGYEVNGRPAPEFTYTDLVRVNPDGSVDTAFIPELPIGFSPYDDRITSVVLDAEDRVIVARRQLTTGQGTIISNTVVRLNHDGALDLSFCPPTMYWSCGGLVAGCNGGVDHVVIQPDGKVLITGDFFDVNGVGRPGLARLNLDGSLDASFDPTPAGWAPCGTCAIYSGTALAVQADGKVLVAAGPQGVKRFHSNGSIDESFDAGSGINGTVHRFAVQPDGQVLIAGRFTAVGGVSRPGIARLKGDGRHVRFGLPVRYPNGAVRLTLNSQPGRIYRLEASTNLCDWTAVSTNVATGYTLALDDPEAAALNQRFYRTVLLP